MKKIILILITLALVCSCSEELASYHFAISAEQIPFSGEGGKATIKVKSNDNWKISSIYDWITFSPQQGKGDGDVIATCMPNESGKEKEGTVYFDSSNSGTKSLKIFQDEGKAILALDELVFSAASEERSFTVQSNVNYKFEIEGNVDWVKVSFDSNDVSQRTLTEKRVFVSVEENRGAERKATIILSNEKVNKRISVIQNAFIKLESLEFSEGNRLCFDEFKDYQLSLNTMPSNSTTKFIWTSSDESVATVSSTGLLSTKSNGETTITVTDKYTNITTSINISVKVIIKAEKISISLPKLNYNQLVTPNVKTTPSNATLDDIVYSCSNDLLEIDGQVIRTKNKSGRGVLYAKLGDLTAQTNFEIEHYYSRTSTPSVTFMATNSGNTGKFSFATTIYSNNPNDVIKITNALLVDQASSVKALMGGSPNLYRDGNGTNSVTITSPEFSGSFPSFNYFDSMLGLWSFILDFEVNGVKYEKVRFYKDF